MAACGATPSVEPTYRLIHDVRDVAPGFGGAEGVADSVRSATGVHRWNDERTIDVSPTGYLLVNADEELHELVRRFLDDVRAK